MVVFARTPGGELRGSGRAIAGFHLRDALDLVAKRAPGMIIRFGGHAFAAGLSLEGAKPVCAIYSTFLQRAYDQIVHDVCLQKLNVVFAMDRAGLVGEPIRIAGRAFTVVGVLQNRGVTGVGDADELARVPVVLALAVDELEYAVCELGFKTAVTTRPGVLYPEHREHLTALPRVSLAGDYQSLTYTALYLSGATFAFRNRFQQVSALHPLRPRPRTDQECDVRAVEGLFGVVRDVDATEQREGAVVELHGGSLGGLDRIGNLQQAQIHLGVRAEHLAGGDAEEDRVADLAGRSGDCDVDGGIAHFCVS